MRHLMFVMVAVLSATATAEAEEADGLVVLGDCVKQFDASPSNHRALGVTGEELGVCLLRARIALVAELELVKSFRPAIPSIEEGLEGLQRMEATVSTVAREGFEVGMTLQEVEHLLKWGPMWLEDDPIVRLRAAVEGLETSRAVLADPML